MLLYSERMRDPRPPLGIAQSHQSMRSIPLTIQLGDETLKLMASSNHALRLRHQPTLASMDCLAKRLQPSARQSTWHGQGIHCEAPLRVTPSLRALKGDLIGGRHVSSVHPDEAGRF
jgi:hypothetical protein